MCVFLHLMFFLCTFSAKFFFTCTFNRKSAQKLVRWKVALKLNVSCREIVRPLPALAFGSTGIPPDNSLHNFYTRLFLAHIFRIKLFVY
jgi:hypothetical protein